jgi:hypothetical protein
MRNLSFTSKTNILILFPGKEIPLFRGQTVDIQAMGFPANRHKKSV